MKRLFGAGRWVYWVLGCSLVFNLAFLGTYLYGAWAHGHGKGLPPLAPPAELKEELGLDDSMWKEFVDSRMRLRGEIHSLRHQVREERTRLWSLMSTDEPDIEAVDRATDNIADLQKQVQRLVVDEMMRLRSGLSAEQRQRFDEHFKNRVCRGGAMCDGGCMGDGPVGHECPMGPMGPSPIGPKGPIGPIL